jgi:tetratricopeptide (TPR) repeat protein
MENNEIQKNQSYDHDNSADKRAVLFVKGNVRIPINDYTCYYRKYRVLELIDKYLKTVPSENLVGLESNCIYDDSPSYERQHTSGCFTQSSDGKGGKISIYLDGACGYMSHDMNKKNMVTSISDRIFIVLFGRMFIVGTLFHEIGHLQGSKKYPDKSVGDDAAEAAAKEYENEMLSKAYPFIIKYDDSFNCLYKFLYKKRIERADQISETIPLFRPDYYDHLGKAYILSGDYEKALTAFNKLVEIDPDFPDAYMNRGIAKRWSNKNDEALEDFNISIQKRPDDPLYYFNRGITYHIMCEHAKAIEDCNRAIELNFPEPTAFALRSDCYKAMGDNEKAEQDLQDAVKLGYKAESRANNK